ncbi:MULTISPECIES: DUF4168 domain-containing protein [unclassified Imperialibacter]|uniref:DUF4168 domain-containing protein n=1 Tax=unclassified Imperialibacter TaxID=2629706 RepID=UPI00125C003F|nr:MULTISPECIES: DUF4168 domain-containing protein [unclassified Imperialibacter]CAD5277900.1 conserved exported hypothetical protein [Imperialibacter sp. 75]CAD5295723.1 conserved exported hypothetical protein [Imperialibacter sp. 89]VVT11829.1 conserved exported hypothetical protein [Imperialibacter sp. EC-SDR9]
MFKAMTKKAKLMLMLAFVASLSLQSSFAQDADAVTDEELTQYATVMNKIDSMKEDLQVRYNEVIKNNELMDEGRRFLELKKAWGDDAKLAEISATDEEKAAYQGILDEYDNMVAEFKEVYPNLIKDDLGAALYNKVRNAMKSDTELKTKYDELLASMQSTDEGDSETDAGGSN